MRKLSKYFTKGLLTGVLATALMAGCSNAAGGNEGGSTVNGEHEFIAVADICGEEHKCKVDGCTEHGYTHPAYMNVTAEFGGQRFVESNADWFSDAQYDKNTKFTNHYNDADKYIDCKVAELNKLWQENNTGSALSNQIGTALQNFNNGDSISQNIDNNYNALAPVFTTMEGLNDLTSDAGIKDYYTYKASYHKLAVSAYMLSLGQYVNNTNDFTSLTEMKNPSFRYEVEQAGLNYDTFNVGQARTKMEQSLNTIADKTDTNRELLKEFVELAMINESLYGLNDYANRVNVSVSGLKSSPRSLTYFEGKISGQQQSLNIDDSTM